MNDELRHSGMTPVPIICPFCEKESMTDYIVWYPTDCPHCKGEASDEVKARAMALQQAVEDAAMKRLAETGDARTKEQIRRDDLELAELGHKLEMTKWFARVAKMYEEECAGPEKWWYLSFADKKAFKGGLYIQARGTTDAIIKAHSMGINPGGEVRSLEVPDGVIEKLPESMRNRLLSKEEVLAL